ncbi:hypothetical protein H6F76_10450 [Leptolyngbya sp. FACHB-321]|uniref:hypothetical protein n=1 Tax=Leptolyngbya sp. FACHB-321 TaxID=2692807 RepID=UPI0016852836|nr:hypothetical protein [Leptolyngbya sp. FACHB-321]MBD2035441.1 hypothetical protein [Leptolyngbya sp. FACHB-321]
MPTSTLINDPALKLKHLSSMVASLSHRLEVARASHNVQLTALLEREYEQLTVEQKAVSFGSSSVMKAWFQRLWNNLADTMPSLYQLQITQTIDDNGHECWSVYYPKTGQRLVTESEAEMQIWIKQNYWAV